MNQVWIGMRSPSLSTQSALSFRPGFSIRTSFNMLWSTQKIVENEKLKVMELTVTNGKDLLATNNGIGTIVGEGAGTVISSTSNVASFLSLSKSSHNDDVNSDLECQGKLI